MPQKHLYLPKLVQDTNVGEPASNALWENNKRKIIKDISDGIEINSSAQSREISSVPDIYARPHMFSGALRSESHPLHKRVLQEWRGLISLLALYRVKPDLDKLQIIRVGFNDEKFCRALLNLAPEPIQLQRNTDYLWTDILLIKFRNIPIGAFCPATLLYTSADYNKTLQNLPGFALKDEEGFLRPPKKDEGLEYVGKWLENFIQEFNKVALTDSSNSDAVRYNGVTNRLLTTWLTEIKAELKIASDRPIQTNRVKVADGIPENILTNSPGFLSRYEIYRQILTPLVKQTGGGGHRSDYSLRVSRNRSPYTEVVVITKSLLSQNRVLWDELTPRELSDDVHSLLETFFSTESGTAINNIDIGQDKGVWIRPELYFLTDTLLKNTTGDGILNSAEQFLNGDNTEFILPFKKEILLFFSPQDIREKLAPRFQKSDGEVVFSFNLPVGSGQSIEIKKTFRAQMSARQRSEGEILEMNVPILEIFPNYLGDFWCQYYMLCSNFDTFGIEPVHYAERIKISRKEQIIESNNGREKAEILKISGYNSFPEGILMTAYGINKPLGLILLSKNPDITDRPFGSSCVVGIDLGTSNTNIYRYNNGDREDGNAHKWVFRFSKYVRSILNSAPSAVADRQESKQKKITRTFFVPTENQYLPIPTLLRIFKTGITKDILLDQFIYFPDNPRYPNYVVTDIKWHEDTTNITAFIRSTLFLLIVDLLHDRIQRIEFRCSYPKSYSDDRVRILKRVWEDSLMNLIYIVPENTPAEAAKDPHVLEDKFIWVEQRMFFKDEGNYHITTENNGELIVNTRPSFATEGVAAGEYFSSEKIIRDGISHANKEDGALCLDVGGGTTDISIWYESRIRFDASVKLAGMQIANLLKNNARLRNLLFSEGSAVALNEVRDDPTLFFSRLNFVLRKEEETILANLGRHALTKDIGWFRQILAIEFGALAFYAGHLTLALNEFLNFRFSERQVNNIFKLHWGGNASKFIKWIDFGRAEANGIAARFLNGIFGNTIYDLNGLGKQRSFRPLQLGQLQSPGHKDEAAGGIVVMENFTPETFINEDLDNIYLDDEKTDNGVMQGVVPGEVIIIAGKTYPPYQVVDRDILFSNDGKSLFEGTELVQLERFIYLVNEVGRRTGLFTEQTLIRLTTEQKISIRNRVKAEMVRQAQRRADERDAEPVIILEIKYLLEILSHRMI